MSAKGEWHRGTAPIPIRSALGGFVKMAQVVAHSPALFPDAFVRACRGWAMLGQGCYGMFWCNMCCECYPLDKYHGILNGAVFE